MDSKGNFEMNSQAVKAMEHLDGKYLIRISDDTLSVEDIALGYKQLLEVERAFRGLKTTQELRPVYYRKEERIRVMSYCVGYPFSSLESQRLIPSKQGPNYARNWKICIDRMRIDRRKGLPKNGVNRRSKEDSFFTCAKILDISLQRGSET